MEEQTPEPMMWKCPLCSADNKVDVETYKICGSCGWGKNGIARWITGIYRKTHMALGNR